MENKFCIKCKEEHGINEFVKNRNYCRKSRNKERSSKNNPVIIKQKKCSSCSKLKFASKFHKDRTQHDGLCDKCKNCRKIDTSKFYEVHKDDIKKKTREYAKQNPEKVRLNRNKRAKERRKEDPLYRISRNLRNRLWYGLQRKSWKKTNKLNDYLGCSLEKLKVHLESQFQPGMSWDNYGSEWDIDHIMPYSGAINLEHLYELSEYRNLKPAFQTYNRNEKRDKIILKDCYKVQLLDKEIARTIIKEEHYLEKAPATKYCFGLIDHRESVKGVIIFSHPSSSYIKDSLVDSNKSMIELSRVWLDDTALKNSESFFISECIKLITEEYVVSYADPTQGHSGIIYQACNFWYLGLTQKTQEYKIKGFENRSSHFKGQTIEQLRLKYGPENIYLADRSQKHIYLYSKTKNKNELMKEIKEYPT